jgi:hypothetical protein
MTPEEQIERLKADIVRYEKLDAAYAGTGLAEEHPLRRLQIKRINVARALLERLET